MLTTPQKKPLSESVRLLSPSFKSPQIKRLDIDSLQRALKDSIELLHAKDNDLKLAAEIGQSLLEANEQMKRECDSILASKTSLRKQAGDLDDVHILDLEKANVDLHRQLEQVSTQLEDIKGSSSKVAVRLKHDLEESKLLVSGLTERVHELERQCQKLADDKAQLFQLQNSQASRASSIHGGSSSSRRIDELESAMLKLSQDNDDLQVELERKSSELVEMSEMNETLQGELESMMQKVQDYDSLSLALEQSNNAYDECQETIRSLQQRLDSQGGPVPPTPLRGSQSLFNEVEDKRLALAEEHSSLESKHMGLLQAHAMGVYQQEKMKNHISRLTQLTNGSGDQVKLRRLEGTLSQLQSENRMLQTKLLVLERSHNSIDVNNCDSTANCNEGKGGQESIAFYKSQLESLSWQLEKARKETRTANMLKINEVDRCRNYEGQLGRKESENANLRARLAQLQFEMDELALNSRIGALNVDIDAIKLDMHSVNDTPSSEPETAPASQPIALNLQPVEIDLKQQTASREDSPTSLLDDKPSEIYVTRDNVNQCNQQ